MVWLVAHMWIGLGLAALFGLLFGWAFRGVRLKAQTRDAMVARDVALTELGQAKLEIDQLYAAQSRGQDAAAEAGDEALRAELEAREAKLHSLSAELASSQEALDSLRTKAAAGGDAGPTRSGAETQLDGNERLDAGLNKAGAALEWRNRYLQSRVRRLEAQSAPAEVQEAGATEAPAVNEALETELAEMRTRAEAAEADLDTRAAQIESLGTELAEARGSAEADREAAIAAALAGAAAGAGAVIAASDEPDAEALVMAEKTAWQNAYLRQRIAYMEEHPPTERAVAVEVAGSVVDEPEFDDEPEEVHIEAAPEPAPPQAEPGELEQELARLRWRNRYLEGRLAYIDGDAPKSDAEIAEAERVAEEAAPVVEGEDPPDDAALAEDDAPTPAEDSDIENAGLTAAEGFLATMDSDGALAKPEMVEAPDGGGDVLTEIDGISGATAGVLNDLGVWRFAQIARWSEANIAWIEQHLNAAGRVGQENWVGQAEALDMRETAD